MNDPTLNLLALLREQVNTWQGFAHFIDATMPSLGAACSQGSKQRLDGIIERAQRGYRVGIGKDITMAGPFAPSQTLSQQIVGEVPRDP